VAFGRKEFAGASVDYRLISEELAEVYPAGFSSSPRLFPRFHPSSFCGSLLDLKDIMGEERRLLTQPVRVVRVDPCGKGQIVTLPAGATVEFTNGPALPGYVEVRCANVCYNAFEADVRARSSNNVDRSRLTNTS
jgi:hypothetical protein